MKRLLLSLLFVVSCDGLATEAPDSGTDARPTTLAPDAEPPCTQLGCVVGCWDGGCGCVDYVCISHDPSVCQGPWPCK